MEHSCFRCGARVEDGTNFCPSCGAPQIRVTASLPREPALQPLPEPAAPSAGEFPAGSAPLRPRDAQMASAPGSAGFDWQYALPAAALGGVCAAVLALLPIISVFFPLWMAASGAFAVAFYRRRKRAAWVEAGDGARLGALAALIGFLPFALVVALEFLFLARQGMMKEVFGRMSATSADPEVQQQMQHILAWLQTPRGAAIAVIGSLAIAFVLFVVLGSIGGAIWAAITGRRDSRAS